MNKPGITLRSYRSTDLDAMCALDVACFDPRFRFSRRAMRRFAEAANALVTIATETGAEEARVMEGFIILHLEDAAEGRAGYVVTLDVAPDRRRGGIATMLMREAECQARDNGCAALTLHVFSGNQSATSFYAHLGFTQLHRARNFYGPGVDAWAFRKLLSPPNI